MEKLNSLLKVAITGNIASGKSTAEEILREKGYKILDADSVAHSLLEDKNIEALIKETFPNSDICEDNKISRKKLGQVVFDDEYSRKKLENIIHPLVKDEIEQFFTKYAAEKIAFVSVPLLFEAKFENLFDKIILVCADDKLRLERLMKRNDLPLDYAQNRIDIQISQDKKISLSDYVIYNDSDLVNLSNEIEKLLIYLDKNSTSPDVK